MHPNNPHKNRIQTWYWGPRGHQYFHYANLAPIWLRNRGRLDEPCYSPDCETVIEKGDWYVKHPELGIVCRVCAAKCGAERP